MKFLIDPSDDKRSPPDPPSKGTDTIGAATAEKPQTVSEQGRVIPIIYGTAKVPVQLIEKIAPIVLQPASYPFGSSVSLGLVVQNAGRVYECIAAGNTAASSVSWHGPGAEAADIADPGGAHWKFLQLMPYPRYLQHFIAAVCEGPADGMRALYWDKEYFSNIGLATTITGKPNATLYLGPDAQNQVVSASFDNSGYQHTALFGSAASALAYVASGTQQEVPNAAVVVQALLFGATGSIDPCPADIINDILTHSRRGCGWPSSRVDTQTTGTGTGSYRTYCDAQGFRLSLVLDTERSALSILADILAATNSDAVWSQGKFKVVPLGDQSITSPVYGATNYVPATTAAYNLGPDDFLDHAQPIRISRRSDTDCFNCWPVEYTDRAGGYVRTTIEDPDQNDIFIRGDIAGGRRAPTLSLPVIFPDGYRVVALARILAHRSTYVRNTYVFRVGWKYLLLEPTDIITLTDPVLGLNLTPVRIIATEETEDGIQITAEDYPAGVAASGGYSPPTMDGYRPQERLSSANVGAIVEAQTRRSGLTANRLYGSDFASGIPTVAGGAMVGGWQISVSTALAFTSAGINLDAAHSLGGTSDANNNASLNTAYLYQNNRVGTPQNCWFGSDYIPVVVGNRYCASVYSGSLRCYTYIGIAWYDVAHAFLGGTSPDVFAKCEAAEAGAGKTIADYKRIYQVATAPASAVYASVILVKQDTDAGQTTSYGFFARAMFEEMLSVTDPLDFSTQGPLLPSTWVQAATTVLDQAAAKSDALQTSNYAEDGSGNPTAGARMQSRGVALKVAAGNLQLGTQLLSALPASQAWQAQCTFNPGVNGTATPAPFFTSSQKFNVSAVSYTGGGTALKYNFTMSPTTSTLLLWGHVWARYTSGGAAITGFDWVLMKESSAYNSYTIRIVDKNGADITPATVSNANIVFEMFFFSYAFGGFVF